MLLPLEYGVTQCICVSIIHIVASLLADITCMQSKFFIQCSNMFPTVYGILEYTVQRLVLLQH